jgi:hypothetical protein
MTNINITSSSAQFYSSVSNSDISTELYEIKWTKNDDNSFALNTSEGIFCITIADFSFNGNTYSTVDDAINYLNTLP